MNSILKTITSAGLLLPKVLSGMFGSRLYEGASPDRNQRPRGMTPGDTSKTVPKWDWLRLLQYSRNLYANLGPLRSAIIDKANAAVVGGWIPQYYGANKEWGNAAEEWLYEWFKICDVRGQPFDFWTGLFLGNIHVDRDGDYGMALIDQSGYPKIQFIMAHRIGTRGSEEIVVDGPYKDARIDNGVIFNDYGQAIAYRVLGDRVDADRDISARDMMLCYEPDWFDQGRGLPSYASSIIDWMDVQDIRHYLKIQVKQDSTLGLTMKTQDGEPDTTAAFFKKGIRGGGVSNQGVVNQNYPPGAETDAASDDVVTIEELDGGAIRYFRAGSGEGVEALSPNRPGGNVSPFIYQIMRGCFQATGIPFEMYDSEGKGGAPMRIIVDRFNKTVQRAQDRTKKMARRASGYALAKAAKLRLLPPLPNDWWMMDFTMPAKLTSDAGYDNQIDEVKLRLGASNLHLICAKTGDWWQDVVDQRIAERKYIEDECAKAGIKPEDIQLLTPNQSANSNQQDQNNQNPNDPNKGN